MYCNHCGNPIPEGMRFCQSCGAPQQGKKSNKSLWVVILLIAVVCVGFFLARGNGKERVSEDTRAAYDLIVDGSYDFKDPTSVRVYSGTVYYDKELDEYSGWFYLSATNGFGARSGGYYFIGYLDGEPFALELDDDSSIRLAKTEGELDVDWINEQLDEKWKNFN